jgi:hypothetical protein
MRSRAGSGPHSTHSKTPANQHAEHEFTKPRSVPLSVGPVFTGASARSTGAANPYRPLGGAIACPRSPGQSSRRSVHPHRPARSGAPVCPPATCQGPGSAGPAVEGLGLRAEGALVLAPREALAARGAAARCRKSPPAGQHSTPRGFIVGCVCAVRFIRSASAGIPA